MAGLISIYVMLGVFVFSFIEKDCTIGYVVKARLPRFWVVTCRKFFAVVTFWPVILAILIYKHYRKNYILRWMDSCEIVKHHLIRMSKRYTADERFPDTLEYYGVTSRYIIENCLEPAMRIFNLEDTPEGWKRAFQYCIRTKRRTQ